MQSNEKRLFYVSHSVKTWVFDQLDRGPGPVYFINYTVLLPYIQSYMNKITELHQMYVLIGENKIWCIVLLISYFCDWPSCE